MATRNSSRQTARRRPQPARTSTTKTLYRRPLRYEPLEDRRLLALVTVNTLADTVDFNDGLTSLREAIFATNLVAGPDAIDFAPALTAAGPATILLAQGELKITDSLTIDGRGAELLTIDAARQSRIFNVSGTREFPDIALTGLTLTRGRSQEAGGAIVAVGGSMQLNDVTISQSMAQRGGAIAVLSGDLQLQRSTLTGNLAPEGSGGAIYAVRPTTIVDSRLDANSARTGGAIAAHHTFELNNSLVDRNSAVFGGGIWVGSNGRLLANGATVSVNRSLDGLGGGIGGDGPITILSSQILFNVSQGNGGGGIGTRNQVTVENSVISGNKASTSGGGIWTTGTLMVSSSVVSNNGAGTLNDSSASGGGIYLAASGLPATIDASTVSGNFAAGPGGGIGTRSSNRVVNVLNSTISGNRARSGGGISGGQITLRHSTIADNSAITVRGDLGVFGGINAAIITLDHTIVANNHEMRSAAPDVNGSISAHFSLIGDSKGTKLVEAPVGSPDVRGNLIGGPVSGVIDPLLGPLADNGGPTITHALLPGSPAINAGDLNAVAGVDGVPLYDQRGEPFTRIFGGRIDIGAFEYQAPSDLNLLVDTLLDESDRDYSRGDLSLREAIELANLWSSADTIHFDPVLTSAGPATILLTIGELKITESLTVSGLGADLLTIDASGNDPTPDINDRKGSRVFMIDDGNRNTVKTVTLFGIALTGGDIYGNGGAIFSRENLTIASSKISGNSIVGDGQGFGGGIYSGPVFNGSPIQLTVRDSTISYNATNSFGGGIATRRAELTVTGSNISHNSASIGGGISGRDGSVTISSSSIYLNSALNSGGGVHIQGGTATITSSSIDVNRANTGGGIVNISSSLTVQDSSLIHNLAGNGDGGAISNEGGNLTVMGSLVHDNRSSGGGGGYLRKRHDQE